MFWYVSLKSKINSTKGFFDLKTMSGRLVTFRNWKDFVRQKRKCLWNGNVIEFVPVADKWSFNTGTWHRLIPSFAHVSSAQNSRRCFEEIKGPWKTQQGTEKNRISRFVQSAFTCQNVDLSGGYPKAMDTVAMKATLWKCSLGLWRVIRFYFIFILFSN